MVTAENDSRSYYLDDFMCETMPCAATLEGWAKWLSEDDESWPHEIPESGTSFAGCATLWKEDILATRSGGEWLLSREPSEDEFVAVRFGKNLGWQPDDIITPEIDWGDAEFPPKETMGQALRRHLVETEEYCDSPTYVAVGEHEGGWRFTYLTSPVRIESARNSDQSPEGENSEAG